MPNNGTTNIKGDKELGIEPEQTKLIFRDIKYESRSEHDQTGGYNLKEIDFAKRLTEVEIKLKAIETRNQVEQTISSERVSPEILYGDESLIIIKAREIIKQGLSFLSDALSSYSEELEREHYIDLFWNIILELQYFLIRTPIDDNLEEGITMLKVALYNHRTNPMKRDEIVGLKIVFEKFMNNIKLPEKILDKCLDKLEEAGFDLSGPLSKVEGLHELE